MRHGVTAWGGRVKAYRVEMRKPPAPFLFTSAKLCRGVVRA
jgi:hypothetical protein